MWYNYFIPIVMALSITLIHFIGERISKHMVKFHFQLQSFGAGLMVGIIFLELLPHVATGQEHLDVFIYIPFLIGFTIIAIIEKIVYRRLYKKQLISEKENKFARKDEENQLKDHRKIMTIDEDKMDCIAKEQTTLFEGIAFVIHYLVLGLLISLIFETYQNISFIILIPIVIRVFSLSFSVEQILGEISNQKAKVIRILSNVAPTLGVLIGFFMVINKMLLYTFFALTIGLILYIVIRDMIPLGRKGKPLYFVLGVILAIGTFIIFELIIV